MSKNLHGFRNFNETLRKDVFHNNIESQKKEDLYSLYIYKINS